MRGTTCLYWQADSELTCCLCPRSGWTWRRPLPFYKSMGCVCRSLAAGCGSSSQDKESCVGRCTADVAMQLVHLWSRPLATTKLQDRLWAQCARHGLGYPLGMYCSPPYASSCGRSWLCASPCGYIVHLRAPSGADPKEPSRTKTSAWKPWRT